MPVAAASLSGEISNVQRRNFATFKNDVILGSQETVQFENSDSNRR